MNRDISPVWFIYSSLMHQGDIWLVTRLGTAGPHEFKENRGSIETVPGRTSDSAPARIYAPSSGISCESDYYCQGCS